MNFGGIKAAIARNNHEIENQRPTNDVEKGLTLIATKTSLALVTQKEKPIDKPKDGPQKTLKNLNDILLERDKFLNKVMERPKIIPKAKELIQRRIKEYNEMLITSLGGHLNSATIIWDHKELSPQQQMLMEANNSQLKRVVYNILKRPHDYA